MFEERCISGGCLSDTHSTQITDLHFPNELIVTWIPSWLLRTVHRPPCLRIALSLFIESFLKGNNLENKVCETCKDDCKHTEVDHNIEVASEEKQSNSKEIQGSKPRFFLFRHRFTSRWPWRRLQAPWPIGSTHTCVARCMSLSEDSIGDGVRFIPKYKDSFPKGDSQRRFLFPSEGRRRWNLTMNTHSPLKFKMGRRK